MIVKCNRKCWDSKRSRQYYPGDQDDIDPLEPIAMYFDFPPGTEVYYKPKAGSKKPVAATTRIVPGLVTEKETLKNLDDEEEKLMKALDSIGKKKEVIKAKIAEEGK